MSQKIYRVQLIGQRIECDTADEAEGVIALYKSRLRSEVIQDFDTKQYIVRIIHPFIAVEE